MNKIIKPSLVLVGFLLPLVVSSAPLTETTGIFDQVGYIISEILVPLAFVLALLYFFWGVAKYIWSVGSAKEEGRGIMMWGVVALFVMSTVWGLVAFIRSELGGGALNNTDIKIPTINGGGGGADRIPCENGFIEC